MFEIGDIITCIKSADGLFGGNLVIGRQYRVIRTYELYPDKILVSDLNCSENEPSEHFGMVGWFRLPRDVKIITF